MARVLVIDDDTQNRTLLKRLLECEGHDVTEAPDGNAGLETYRQAPSDLVVTDIIMPEKDGIETIREFRRDFPDLKIIALSGGGRVMDGESCLNVAEKMGAHRTFTKPLDLKGFLEAIHELLED